MSELIVLAGCYGSGKTSLGLNLSLKRKAEGRHVIAVDLDVINPYVRMTDGAESKRPSLIAKARSLVKSFLKAARDEADTHSPSKKTIAIFEDIGEGAVVGTEHKTEDVKKAATKQMAEVMDVYGSPEANGQKVFRSIAEQQTARQTAGQQAMAVANGPMLEKILTAIEKGQIITLDGDALVGATANKMDNALGRRRALASRGAI